MKGGFSLENISDARSYWCKGPEKETNLPCSGKVTIKFGKLGEGYLEKVGLGKGKNLSTEFGFYSESNEKPLGDLTQRGRERKQKQEDQFGVVLVRGNCLNNYLTLNLELPDGTSIVCLFFHLYFGSKTDTHFMYLHIWKSRTINKYC